MSSIFVSYSHKDESLKDELLAHLAVLNREDGFEVWHDRKIPVGDEFARAIDQRLNSAKVILLLVSSDFLASRYCYDIEVQRAIERHIDGTARVIPIILRPCDWIHCPLAALLAAPKDGKAVTTWASLDEAFLDVVQHLRRAVTGKINTARIPVEKLTAIRRSLITIKLLNNMRQLRAAVDQFLLENGVNRANWDDIIGSDKYLRDLPQIDGENYRQLDLAIGARWEIVSKSGVVARL